MSNWLLVSVAALALACHPVAAAPGGGEDDPANSWFAQQAQPASPSRGAVGPRSRAGDLVISALNFLDMPYRLGGQATEDGFDCSGFTRHVFAQTLVSEPALHTASVGLAGFVGELSTPMHTVMAIGLMYTLPAVVFYLFVQRYVVSGMTAGSVKG